MIKNELESQNLPIEGARSAHKLVQQDILELEDIEEVSE